MLETQFEQLLKDFSRDFGLTARETHVLSSLIHKAQNFKELGAELAISPNTVNNHLKNIFKKTATHSKSELVAKFFLSLLQQPSRSKLPPVGGGLRVLICDDEAELVELVADSLRERGVEVYTLCDSRQALAAVDRYYPDVILSDIRMPGKDGVAILKELRERSPLYPTVIFMSGYADYDFEELLSWGGVDLIEKPASPHQIYQTILKHTLAHLPGQSPAFSFDVAGAYHFGEVPVGFGGVFISREKMDRAQAPWELGRELSFSFTIPAEDPPGRLGFQAVGEIIWKRERQDAHLMAGVGVRFVHIELEKLQFLKLNLLEKNNREHIPLGKKMSA